MMDAITVITYICACLGGVLLLLCIVLAGILLYTQCKRGRVRFPGGYLETNPTENVQRYVIFSSDDNELKEEGNILLQRYDGTNKINFIIFLITEVNINVQRTYLMANL